MDIHEISKVIFSSEVLKDETGSKSKAEWKANVLSQAGTYVNEKLDAVAPLNLKLPKDKRRGRIGSEITIFDVNANYGLFIIGTEKLSLNSQGNFSTILSNTCVYRGKWQYEVQLGTKGVMQIGWATQGCHFSQETGVGDTMDSYAYDGNRVRKWNGYTEKYGQPWLSGDIIGCCGDFDVGSLTFYRNGVSLGQAFNDVILGPGKAYFPAVSIGFGEHLVANFGGAPFRYPVAAHEPLQAPPVGLLSRCDLILSWFYNYLSVCENLKVSPMDENDISLDAFLLALARILFYALAPLLYVPYVCDARILPFIERLSEEPGEKFMHFFDVLWSFLDEIEMRMFLENICSTLLSRFRHVPSLLSYSDQKQNLKILYRLCEHAQTRQMLIRSIFFDSVKLAEFLHVKMLDEPTLIQIVDKPWWDSHIPNNKMLEDRKKSYFDSCARIGSAVNEVEVLQISLLKLLMTNTDGSKRNASSRKIFLKRLRIFFHDNYMSTRSLPLVQVPLPVTLCCFHRLASTFQEIWEEELGNVPSNIPSRMFYDGSVSYYTIDRIGGVYTHLMKAFRAELVKNLGANHDVLTGKAVQENPSTGRMLSSIEVFPSISIRMPQDEANQALMIPNFVPVLTRLIQQANAGPVGGHSFEIPAALGMLKPDQSRVSSGDVESLFSMFELLDGLILFYHTSAHRQISKVSVMRDNMEEYVSAYETARQRVALVKNKPAKNKKERDSAAILSEVQNSSIVFENKLNEQARFMAWVRAAIFSNTKRAQIAWLLQIVLNASKASYQDGALFSFLPEFYLDSLFELLSALRNHMHPTCPIDTCPQYQSLLQESAEFLCRCFTDPRVVNASSKDTIVQAMANLVVEPSTMAALEKVPEEQRKQVVRTLLRPYENRAWAQSNWVLMRFWQGRGFAFRYDKSPHLGKKHGPKFIQGDNSIMSQGVKPLPSTIFQNHVKDLLLRDEPVATAFINSVLNQLNWSFSEFIGMLQEIQNISNRPERVYIESRQLRICSTCFDLSLSLLRVVEMIATLAPSVFNDKNRPNSELLFSRLCQLICQILNRISSRTGCFQHIVTLEIPDLEAVDHFPILTAVLGILIAIYRSDLKNVKDNQPISPMVKTLLTEPSFQLKSLTFVLGEIGERPSVQNRTKVFSLANYKGDVSDDELIQVTQLIKMLEKSQRKVSAVSLNSDDDVCTICYANAVSVIFKPCNHQSCKSCIGHHLLNGTECFFCKANIERVLDLQGNVIHDLGSPNA